jgi:CheY-like chemotaxis protein
MSFAHHIENKRILLVDDEPSVRQALSLLLNVDRHTVVEASNGKEACHRYTPGMFDLVITDYSMPEMKGDELARTIKCLVPTQRILMISAYAPQVYSPENPVDALLPKPFSLEQLRQTITAMFAPAGIAEPVAG